MNSSSIQFLRAALDRVPPLMKPFVGAELEFYVPCITDKFMEELSVRLDGICQIAPEACDFQYEFCFPPTHDVGLLAYNICLARDAAKKIAEIHGIRAIFDSRPFPDQSGSAMHIHINYTNNDGINLFSKCSGQERVELLYSVGGLCKFMRTHMRYFASNVESYSRFINPCMHTPTKISWGLNNRTVAIRIPDTNGQQQYRRLEHRVPCSDSDPYYVIGAIIIGSLSGIAGCMLPPPQTHGLAFDEQYNLESLPTTAKEAASYADMDI